MACCFHLYLGPIRDLQKNGAILVGLDYLDWMVCEWLSENNSPILLFQLRYRFNFNYYVSEGRLKSAEEDDPSAETLSVVLGLLLPPRRMTSPDLRPQQRWSSLLSTRVTGNLVKEEVPSNISQDLSGSGEPYPPQSILLHIWASRRVWGRSPTGQECPVIGLKTSADIRTDPLYPPAIINPKHLTFRTL